jgi:hypothetical protein
LFDNIITAFFVSFEIGFQEVGKKYHSENHKHDKQFDDDDKPHLFAPACEVPESFDVKEKNPFKDVLLFIHLSKKLIVEG